MKTLETLKFIGRIRSNKNRQRGFTLIELVIVLAVLGVLAAIAIPQLTGLQSEAELQGVASTLASEAGNQFAADLLNDNNASDWETGDACGNLLGTLLDGSTSITNPGDYEVTDGDSGDVVFSIPALDTDGDVVSDDCSLAED